MTVDREDGVTEHLEETLARLDEIILEILEFRNELILKRDTLDDRSEDSSTAKFVPFDRKLDAIDLKLANLVNSLGPKIDFNEV